MHFLLRFLSLICLAAATIAGTIDSIQSIAASTVVMTTFGDAWKGVSASTFEKLRSAISSGEGGGYYRPAVEWIMAQPAFAIFLALALLMWVMAYRRLPAARRFAV